MAWQLSCLAWKALPCLQTKSKGAGDKEEEDRGRLVLLNKYGVYLRKLDFECGKDDVGTGSDEGDSDDETESLATEAIKHAAERYKERKVAVAVAILRGDTHRWQAGIEQEERTREGLRFQEANEEKL